jgi:hypothetical protein
MGCPTLSLNQNLGWNPGTIGGNHTITISLSGIVPAGATIAYLTIGIGSKAPAGAAVDSAGASGNLYSPVRTQVDGQYADGFMLAPIDASGNIRISNQSSASFRLMDARQAVGGGRSLDQCVARLWFGQPLTISNPGQPNNIASVSDADNWLRTNGYYDSLNYFVTNGGRNCVVFNELNQTSEPQYQIDPRIIGYLGYALQNAYWNQGNRLLYTLLPGPSGLLKTQDDFNNYFRYSTSAPNFNYDLWTSSNSTWQSFGQHYGSSVDQTIATRSMLHHGGSGVYDRIALHCYAECPLYDPVLCPYAFSNASIATNPALQYIQWMLGVDPSGPIYVTEASGSHAFDDYDEGVALAEFEQTVSNLNAQSIALGGFGGQVQAIYGYILDISNGDASRGGIDRLSCRATDGYNYERGVLGF